MEENKSNIDNSEIKSLNFIQEKIEEDFKTNKYQGRVHTRFPPEPNGYLHIGHAKSICLNFGLAKQYNGKCNLRFDDTNPTKEDVEYVDSIREDVKWLGFDWEDREFYASDYFETLYQHAEALIKLGKAYVDDSTAEEVAKHRGTPTIPGTESPYRNRTIEENLDLFRRMKAGEFPDGSKILRAKIDLASPNMHMRDPAIYRIRRSHHHRTGDNWCIYPMYDFAHGISDSIEGITHSICTLEFEIHRPLYDWFIDQLGIYHPQQIEFARLNLNYTIMSKRKLLLLVQEGVVNGWDDPRMPTISGLRRRGYTPESIRNFADKIGVAKRDNTIDTALLEHSIREDLNKRADRRMVVFNPLKVIITNYPDGQSEELEAVNNPEDISTGTRKIPFSKEVFIDQDDFMENPPKKYFRLQPGGEVRLKYAYIIKCNEVVKDEDGNIIELRCEYDVETKSGSGTSQKKVKGTIHWVNAKTAKEIEVRLYDRLFSVENPGNEEDGKTFLDYVNPNSLTILNNALSEPSLLDAKIGEKFQFERLGYFNVDIDSLEGRPIFNRTVTLKDSWSKQPK